MVDTARQEVLYRMRLRESALLVYIAFVGAIFSVAFAKPDTNGEVLLSIPFLALGVSILISQHYMMVAAIGQFCTNELALAPQWDNSKAFKQYADTSALLRVGGHIVIIFVPCFGAFAINSNHITGNYPFVLAWWFGLIFCFIAVSIILFAHNKRRKIYDKRSWNDDSKST